MVMTKISMEGGEDLPPGFMRVNKGEPFGHYKVGKELTGEAFITNLEQVNKRRVELQSAMAETATPAAQAEL